MRMSLMRSHRLCVPQMVVYKTLIPTPLHNPQIPGFCVS
jgi:hypothetical protein